jgi:beta-glucosidase
VSTTASTTTSWLHEILRNEWHFSGLVVSDWDSVGELVAHGVANDRASAASKSFLAGVDVDMESGSFHAELARLVRAGTIPRPKVDDAVRRMLRLKAALGLFDRPYTDGARDAGPLPTESRALARTAAVESFVLLQNEPVHGQPILPLDCRPGRRIALIGALADSPIDMLGPWMARGSPSDVTTLRTALADRAASLHMTVLFARGTDLLGQETTGFAQAVATARGADIVVIALGDRGEWTGNEIRFATSGTPPTCPRA